MKRKTADDHYRDAIMHAEFNYPGVHFLIKSIVVIEVVALLGLIGLVAFGR